MITFGLTGGIASGKSTVTKTFRKHFISIVDADIIAREVVEVGTLGWRIIRALFGPEYLNDDQTVNRTKLGALVFADAQAMHHLNFHMKNLIGEESYKQIRELHNSGAKIVGYDAALIIEHGNNVKYDPLIVVSCPIEMQLERLMKRNAFSHDEAMARISSQMPLFEKIKFADYVIDTSGSIESSIAQTEKIISQLKVSL